MATHGRFFLGSNKVMQVALGRDETTEFRPQLQALGVRLAGFAGLLCTECVPRVVASGVVVPCCQCFQRRN